MNFGLVRVAAVSPKVKVGNVAANVAEIKQAIFYFTKTDPAEIIVFPELSITGYTCGDLFGQTKLLDAAEAGLWEIANSVEKNQLVVVGLPFRVGNALYNCAAVLSNGQILGIVPKQHIPNYKEFYESRWFKAAKNISTLIPFPRYCEGRQYMPNTRFGTDLLFRAGEVVVGVEICEDGWMPIPPSSHQAIAGANILLNLSASNEVVGKGDYRAHQVVQAQSGRCIAAYIYACASPTESTSDIVMAGDCIIAENGSILERVRLEPHASIITDVDVEKLQNERRQTISFATLEPDQTYRFIDFNLRDSSDSRPLKRHVDAHPFVPADNAQLNDRCETIFKIQVLGLQKRWDQMCGHPMYLGLSGGLDSTLALLVAKAAGVDVRAITMPGFGTTDKTLNNAKRLAKLLDVPCETIDIRKTCLNIFKDQNYKPFDIDVDHLLLFPEAVDEFQELLQEIPPNSKDLKFENIQARVRTLELFSRGFVLGTGDLSEMALGWSTYNGDHMSSYNVNCGVPKTLVKFLVGWIARNRYSKGDIAIPGSVAEVLMDIVNTVISPELLPVGPNGEVQSSEDFLGPYELHDFFLYHFVRNGFSPEKILYLANQCKFDVDYSPEFIKNTLRTFLKRFFHNQFKRNCVPDGPKVGTVSLSPRGDWRMPSEADLALWGVG
ncbi:MAG: NAD(+) synthase [Proteobacteria bacterium]|jgi:NAD+ synthase (glutamine-hydrolysing)|nr:NAD(+) synthase [Pseudomonadota bacterium]